MTAGPTIGRVFGPGGPSGPSDSGNPDQGKTRANAGLVRVVRVDRVSLRKLPTNLRKTNRFSFYPDHPDHPDQERENKGLAGPGDNSYPDQAGTYPDQGEFYLDRALPDPMTAPVGRCRTCRFTAPLNVDAECGACAWSQVRRQAEDERTGQGPSFLSEASGNHVSGGKKSEAAWVAGQVLPSRGSAAGSSCDRRGDGEGLDA